MSSSGLVATLPWWAQLAAIVPLALAVLAFAIFGLWVTRRPS